MGQQPTREPLNDAESDRERKLSVIENDGRRRSPPCECGPLPKLLTDRVIDSMSNDKRHFERNFFDRRRITLCLSHHANPKLGPFWHYGCLTPGDPWESSMKVKVDRHYEIKDYQKCLDLLVPVNSCDFPHDIKVLVLQLEMSSQDFSGVLTDLEHTLTKLQGPLHSVQHVVIKVRKGSFCCFSLKDVVDSETGLSRTVNRPLALKQILDDLRLYRATYQRHNTMALLNFYILNNVKPESDVYLSSFVISPSYRLNRDILYAVDPNLRCNKLKFIYSLKTLYDLKHFDKRLARRCHAFRLDTSEIVGWNSSINSLPSAYDFKDNHFIERIWINSGAHGRAIHLPRTGAHLANATLQSALVEITLKGSDNILPLADLNNGHFPHLKRLSVIGGKITGHLDSYRVPLLKTLNLELEFDILQSRSKVGVLPQELTREIVGSRLPWQLVATQDQLGWSLASYENADANPQEDVKEEFPLFPPSLPVIKALLLMANGPRNALEWEFQLNGDPSLDAIFEDNREGQLMWAPECVEKITLLSTVNPDYPFYITKQIPGETRILSSLTCRGINRVVLDGAVLPHLKSLEMKGVGVIMRGSFPRLETLSFEKLSFENLWELNAPMLQSLSCMRMWSGEDLFLCSELPPRLSYLRMAPRDFESPPCPTILFGENSLGLSQVKHVVFGFGMTYVPCFDQYQVHRVSHLVLDVDAFELPQCWLNTEWQCETLTINVFAHCPAYLGTTVTKMPPRLPLVRTLTVTSYHLVPVMLDSEMLHLTECTVPKPQSLGPNLKCPALQGIRFSAYLKEKDREKCLDPATYEAIGAHPEWVHLSYNGEVHRLVWDASPNGKENGDL